MLGEELVDELVDDLVDDLVEGENQRLRPLPGAPDVVSRRTDTGSKGYPLLGSARGAKEAEIRLRGRRSGQALLSTIKACNQRDTRSYPGSGRPEAKSPTPACLDIWVLHSVEYNGVLRAGYPEGFWLEVEEGQILTRRRSPSSLPSQP